jgi:hypothetical protein
MAKRDVRSELDARVKAFVAELEELVRKAALAAVEEALGSKAPSRGAGKRAPSRRAEQPASEGGKGTKGARSRRGQGPKGRAAKGKAGGRVRRSSDELETLRKRIIAEVGREPGIRVGALAEALGMSSKELALPVRKLVQEKLLRTKGEKRATEYFVG